MIVDAKQGTLEFPELIRTFLAISLASEGIGRITSSAPDRAKAQAAARAIFHLIDTAAQTCAPLAPPLRPPCAPLAPPLAPCLVRAPTLGAGRRPIDPLDEAEGDRLAAFEGSITLRNVSFAYPSRPDVQVRLGRFLARARGPGRCL